MIDVSIELLFFAIGSFVVMFFVGGIIIQSIPYKLNVKWRSESLEYIDSSNEPIFEDFKMAVRSKFILSALATIVSALVIYTNGPNIDSYVFSIFFVILVLLVGINNKHLLIPDIIVWPLIWSGLIYQSYVGDNLEYYLYSVLIAFSLIFILQQFYIHIKGFEILGGGDLKMFMAIGAWFGYELLPAFFAICFFTGLTIGLLASFTNRFHAKGTSVIYLISALIIYFNANSLSI